MCGLQLLFTCATTRFVEPSQCLRARGPDEFRAGMAAHRPYRFDRLHVTGERNQGMQPSTVRDVTMMANAEVFLPPQAITSCETSLKSDCGVLMHAFSKSKGLASLSEELSALPAEFAAVWVDEHTGIVIACRDAYGVRPLYQARCIFCKNVVFASELGALARFPEYADTVVQVKPKHLTTGNCAADVVLPKPDPIPLDVAHAFASVVGARLLGCEQSSEVAVLLSGGLDSTAVAYLASMAQLPNKPKLRFFTFFHNTESPDLKWARVVASTLKVPLVEYHIKPTLEDVKETVRVVSSFDTTTVRASTMQLLAFKRMRRDFPSIKVVLCGEGADELLGGYQYFKCAPNERAAEAECDYLLENIHLYDGLRVDRTAARFGFEVRLPFLDARFIETVKKISIEERFDLDSSTTKSWFRAKLAMGLPRIPEAVLEVILGRAKDAMSDAVGASWREEVGRLAASNVLSSHTVQLEGGPTPRTAEERFYAACFVEAYPLVKKSPIPDYWKPRWINQEDEADPSATTWPCYSV